MQKFNVALDSMVLIACRQNLNMGSPLQHHLGLTDAADKCLPTTLTDIRRYAAADDEKSAKRRLYGVQFRPDVNAQSQTKYGLASVTSQLAVWIIHQRFGINHIARSSHGVVQRSSSSIWCQGQCNRQDQLKTDQLQTACLNWIGEPAMIN
jgi:hypothetical protein